MTHINAPEGTHTRGNGLEFRQLEDHHDLGNDSSEE